MLSPNEKTKLIQTRDDINSVKQEKNSAIYRTFLGELRWKADKFS